MELRPQLKQQQKLVMTVFMQQAIKLLQLNSVELSQVIEEELIENPSLELDEEGRSLTEHEIHRQEQGDVESQDLQEQQNGAEENDTIWETFFEADQRHTESVHNMRGGYIYKDLPPIESTLSASSTLTEHLWEQFRLEYCTDGEREAADFIMGNLDHRGYLDCSYEEILKHTGVHEDDLEGAILIIRELEPIGCAARDLVECLCFQAEIRYPEDPFFVDLIRHHLKDIRKKSYDKVGEAMDMDAEDVEEYHRMLEDFEPHPGRQFMDLENQTITPDLKIVKVGDDWQIVSHQDGLPKIKLSAFYQKMFQEAQGNSKDKKFVEDKMRSAKFLLQSIYKREQTLLQTMEAILMRQIEFFEHGPEFMRPMVLREVAYDVGVSESTISRITTSKYVESPYGLLSLKYFFNSGVPASDGQEYSAVAVKYKIQRYISQENPRKPLSDNALVGLLNEEGLYIARRTVSKYREAMKIPSSRERRQR